MGGAGKHIIYAAAIGGHLFMTYFYRARWVGHGPLGTTPPPESVTGECNVFIRVCLSTGCLPLEGVCLVGHGGGGGGSTYWNNTCSELFCEENH